MTKKSTPDAIEDAMNSILPNTLLIGGMKCGTTTLFFDLASSRDVLMPREKETKDLAGENVLTTAGLAEYSKRYKGSARRPIVLDASTDYSKYPIVQGVPSRAVQVLGPNIRILYSVRHPIERIISHLRHDLALKRITHDQATRLATTEPYVAPSRYALQVQQWSQAFDQRQIYVSKFEDFVQDRIATAQEIANFLGVRDYSPNIAVHRAYNASAEQRIPTGAVSKLQSSSGYHKFIRPLLSPVARQHLRRVFVPSARGLEDIKLPEHVRMQLGELLDDDQRQFGRIMGWRYAL